MRAGLDTLQQPMTSIGVDRFVKQDALQVRSEVARLKNSTGREAGSSTAAAFLAAFAEDTPWVHLDIAGTGWTTKPAGYQPRGATGVGVRLVVEALRNLRDAKLD